MPLYKKILCCNILRHKFLFNLYIVNCSLIVSYCVFKIYFSQRTIMLDNEEQKFSTETTNSSSILVDGTELSMKHILLWTSPNKFPFIYFGEGNSIFVNKSCKWTNCYVTADRNFLGPYSDFEVIAFNGPELQELLLTRDLPKKRQWHQKYVYANIESAANYPFRSNEFNDFFNWTWTYKLNSDAGWVYIVVKDVNNSVIGPREHVNWLGVEDMDPIDSDLKLRLQSKKKAAAWMCSNCLTAGRREDHVKALQYYLNGYNHKVDVYGTCGDHKCPKEIMPRCLKMLQKDYYFYLAFENSLSDDYVTEKILYALNSDTIPVVYGGANYSRFLPEGIYLDALKLGPRKLATTMVEIINDREAFHRFFRWKRYYSFHYSHETPKTDVYCHFCAIVNNKTAMSEHKTYEKFNKWWMHKVTKII